MRKRINWRKLIQGILLGGLFVAEQFVAIASTVVYCNMYKMGTADLDGMLYVALTYVLCAIDMGAMVRLAKGRKNVILPMLGMVAALFPILLSSYAIAETLRWKQLHSLTVCFLTIVTGIFCATRKLAKKNDIKHLPPEIQAEELMFHRFSAEWYWDDVAEEYCALQGYRSDVDDRDLILSGQTDKLYTYATGYFAYLFAWLVKRDGLSDIGMEGHRADLKLIKAEQYDPAEFLYNSMDGKVLRQDVTEEMAQFLDGYYESAKGRHFNYERDYKAIVKGKGDVKYCQPFSWDAYHRFEKVLDEHFSYFKREQLLARYDFGTWDNEVVYAPAFAQNISVTYQMLEQPDDGAYNAYIKRCVEHVKTLSRSITDNIATRARNFGLLFGQKERLDNSVDQVELLVFVPYGDELAYVLSFNAAGADKGVSVVIRGDRVMDVTERGKWDSPWSENNERRFRNMGGERLRSMR